MFAKKSIVFRDKISAFEPFFSDFTSKFPSFAFVKKGVCKAKIRGK